jgi:outer membrane protein W
MSSFFGGSGAAAAAPAGELIVRLTGAKLTPDMNQRKEQMKLQIQQEVR